MSQQPRERDSIGLEEYQRLLTLLDQRRFDEAQVRARFLLERPGLAPLVETKTHNLLCWIFVEALKSPAAEAILHGEEAVTLAQAHGLGALHAESLINLAGALYQMGDFARSRKCYEELELALTEQPSLMPLGRIIVQQGFAQVAAVENRLNDAMDHLNNAMALCTKDQSAFMRADTIRRRALLYLRLGQSDLAALDMEQVDESAVGSGNRSLWWKTHYRFTLARIELARGHWVSARPLIINTLALARELADQPVLAECLCLLALVEQAEGRKEAPKRARTALTTAINSGRRDVVEEVRNRLKDLLASFQ